MKKLMKIINIFVLVIGYLSLLNIFLFFGGINSRLFENSSEAGNDLSACQVRVDDEALKADLTGFYLDAKDGNWETLYGRLSSKNRNNITAETFIQMAKSGKRSWNLNSFKVLSFQSFPQESYARCVMFFDESGVQHYSVSQWVLEDGQWKCRESGLTGMTVFYPLINITEGL